MQYFSQRIQPEISFWIFFLYIFQTSMSPYALKVNYVVLSRSDSRWPDYQWATVTHAAVFWYSWLGIPSAFCNLLPIYVSANVDGPTQWPFCTSTKPMRNNVTLSLIGWAHTQNDPCLPTNIDRNLCSKWHPTIWNHEYEKIYKMRWFYTNVFKNYAEHIWVCINYKFHVEWGNSQTRKVHVFQTI